MGKNDEMADGLDRGGEVEGQTAKSTLLKIQIAELAGRRHELEAQLGASLYEETKNNALLRKGREGLYDAIERIDTRCESIYVEIKALETPLDPPSTVDSAISCPECGSEILREDFFCSGCGLSAEAARAAVRKKRASAAESSTLSEIICSRCGAVIKSNHAFCGKCGASAEAARAEAANRNHTKLTDANLPESGICPSCGESVFPEDRFCMKCGTSLS